MKANNNKQEKDLEKDKNCKDLKENELDEVNAGGRVPYIPQTWHVGYRKK